MNAHELVGNVREALRSMTSREQHVAQGLLRELTECPDMARSLRLLERDIQEAKECIERAEDILKSHKKATR